MSPTEFEEQLASVGRLTNPGWDSYGALPISPTAVRVAGLVAVAMVRYARSQWPYPFPTTQGGVVLAWGEPDDVTVEVDADGRASVWAEGVTE